MHDEMQSSAETCEAFRNVLCITGLCRIEYGNLSGCLLYFSIVVVVVKGHGDFRGKGSLRGDSLSDKVPS